MVNFDEFKTFYNKFPERPNSFYYKQFSEGNKSTIRNYKYRCRLAKNTVATHDATSNKRITKSNQKQPTIPPGGSSAVPSLTRDILSKMTVKAKLKLLGETAVDEYLLTKREPRILSKSIDLLSGDHFIEENPMPTWERPDWIYPWQNVACDLMHEGHTLYQAGRQKIGKTTIAFMCDFEDMLVPGTVVTLVAPGLEQAEALLRQGFKERLTLPDGTKFDLWNQLYKPYFMEFRVKRCMLWNGSILQVIPCSEYTTPGYATDVLHIEELDKIVKDPQKLRGLGAVLPTVRAKEKYARFRITCNNKAGVYRILREDLKDLYPYFTIYREVPWDISKEKFTGKHEIYNRQYNCKERPDIDLILKRIMDVVMGEEYTAQELGNVDDYSGEVFNPDKVDIAYRKGKKFRPKAFYEHSILSIDPGAIHDFAAGIIGMEGLEFFHLWNESFTVSGKTEKEKEIMLKRIAKTCAIEYVRMHCTHIVAESNSGAKLIIPMINHHIRKELDRMTSEEKVDCFAEVNIPVWSNWGGDKEQGPEAPKIYSRVEYITLMQTVFDYGKITLQDKDKFGHKMRIEFARYKPQDSKEKYKGDSVDMMMHGIWYLGKGRSYVERLLEIEEDEEVAFVY